MMRIRVLVLAGLLLLAAPASAVTIDWVAIGDAGNTADPDTNTDNCAPDDQPCGAVAYDYYISKYEVTNAQYAEFLNAKAAADSLGLYNGNMDFEPQGGITRSGVSGSYSYAPKPGFGSKPVNFVSFYDALRFTNWLNNGQGSASTETGAYTLLGGTATPSNADTVTRSPGANIFVPSDHEWYKAAYFNGATYLNYPVGTDTPTVCAAPGATANTANCGNVVGNVTDVGAYTGSASPYGTFDQGGNVGEWNEWMPLTPGVRGGEWVTGAVALAASDRVGTVPSFEFAFVGFRVASLVPEPDGSLLAILGLAGLAARRRT